MSNQDDYLEIVKESFDPQLITALFKNFSNKYIAFQELLDNSVDDRIDGKKLLVSIIYGAERDRLVIKNVNGKGMDLDDIKSFFRWGRTKGREDRIGRYGQGGKAALGYLASSFTIKSNPKNSSNGYLIKVENWEDRKKGFKEFKIEAFQVLEERGSVSFELWNLRRKFNLSTIIDKISEIYRPLIQHEKVEFRVNGVEISCDKANYDSGTKTAFSIPIKTNGITLKLIGEYGIVSDIKSLRGGFNVYQFGRQITEKEYFGRIDPSKRWNVERLYGELYLDFEVPLLMNKTDVDRDSEVWKEISSAMHREIDEIIKIAIDYKTPTKKEKKALRQVEKKVRKSISGKSEELRLANYGRNILYKIKTDKEGHDQIIINRQHPAYFYWSKTSLGKRLYFFMIYSLYKTSEKLKKKEVTKLHNAFSKSLSDQVKNLY